MNAGTSTFFFISHPLAIVAQIHVIQLMVSLKTASPYRVDGAEVFSPVDFTSSRLEKPLKFVFCTSYCKN